MATLKQQKFLHRLKGQVGLQRYRRVKRNLGYGRLNKVDLSTAEASRLIGSLLNDIEQEKKNNFNFAMRLYSLQIKDTRPRK